MLNQLSQVPSPFALVIFHTGSLVFAQTDLNCNPFTFISGIAGTTGIHHTHTLLVEMEYHHL
jgi:hypothetical protein